MDGFETRLKGAIEASGMTQLELSKRIGVQPNLVSSWVTGRSLPSVPNLAQLVPALEADAGWLLLGAAPKRDREDPVASKVRRLGGDLIELVELARDSGGPHA